MFSRHFFRRNAPILAANLLPEPDSKTVDAKILTLRISDSSHLQLYFVSTKPYNSYEINQLFEGLLAERDAISKKVPLNLPRTPPEIPNANR